MQDNISKTSADWTQVRETVLMLDTVVTQLGWTLRDGDGSVDTLTESFQSMVESASAILNAVSSMEDGASKDEILHHSQAIYGQMQHAIVAFQFYDKLSQRLDHVSESLSSLTALIGNPKELYSPIAWQGLQETIRSKYTMEEERRMFDRVISGVPIEEALIEFNQDMANNNDSEEDEIELF